MSVKSIGYLLLIALLAALLLAEQPTLIQLAGGVLVLVGVALVQLTPVSRPGGTGRIPAASDRPSGPRTT